MNRVLSNMFFFTISFYFNQYYIRKILTEGEIIIGFKIYDLNQKIMYENVYFIHTLMKIFYLFIIEKKKCFKDENLRNVRI